MSEVPVILCSGFGLGFYIPGLLIRESLKELGVSSEVEVFDSLLPESKRQVVTDKTRAYRDDFRIAIAAQKIPGDIRASWNIEAVTALLLDWHKKDRRRFVCLSGHWVHVLNLYRALKPSVAIDVDLLYLDVKPAPSWKQTRKIDPLYEESFNVVRFYDAEKCSVEFCIDTNLGAPMPYDRRNGHLVVHGGGMGIGTYRERVPFLEKVGFLLDVAFHSSTTEPRPDLTSCAYYQDDPDWRAWHRGASGDYSFPPFGRISSEEDPQRFQPQTGCNGLHRVIRESSAIVSKPGAGTLIDSLASATPVILLEPFGPHEEENAKLWVACGFGISYQEWEKANFSRERLCEMHANLLAAKLKIPGYAQTLANSRITFPSSYSRSPSP